MGLFCAATVRRGALEVAPNWGQLAKCQRSCPKIPLTDAAIRKAAPGEKLRRLSDERGLSLEIAPSGGKWWRWKYRYGGTERRLSLGTYPDTTLKAAREARDGARSPLASGIDPGAARKAFKAARTDALADSFEAVAREGLSAIHGAKVREGHAERTRSRLEQDVFPWLVRSGLARSRPLSCWHVRRVEAVTGFPRCAAKS